jgi:hypothetical protein
MNTCDTCKHWKKSPYSHIPDNEYEFDNDDDYDFCEGTRWRHCKHPKMTPSVNPSDPKFDDFAITDGERGDDEYANIVTGPKFGCIHHEPK